MSVTTLTLIEQIVALVDIMLVLKLTIMIASVVIVVIAFNGVIPYFLYDGEYS